MSMRFKTERLIGREHSESDLKDLHLLLSDDISMRYLPEIQCRSLEESTRNLCHAIGESKSVDRRDYFYAVELLNGEYIGEIGITTLAVCEDGRMGNLGYFLRRHSHGNGYATEATIGMLRHTFYDLDFVKIESGCLAENLASERVLIKAGLRKESGIVKHVVHERLLKERVEYAITRTEWQNSSSGKKTFHQQMNECVQAKEKFLEEYLG